MIKYIKKIIPKSLKQKVKMIIGYWKHKGRYSNLEGNKHIFIVGVPSHGNLGDQAIIYAEREFLKNYFKEYEIIEIHTLEALNHIRAIKRYLKKDDIIMLHGGGNFGVEYFIEEEVRREVIKRIKFNPIIFFPQTMDFGKTDKGQKELDISKAIYKRNPNLVLVAREQASYELMKGNFPYNKVLLTPDIVISLDKQDNSKNRVGAMVCMREDCESILSTQEHKKILKICQDKFEKVIITDTVVNRSIFIEERKNELDSKWNEFRQAELVVTDRLHGMVFAAITGTPCIVMSNYNHKVKGTYEWIKHLEYIKFVDTADEAVAQIEQFEKKELSECGYKYKQKTILEAYIPLEACIRERSVN